MNEADTCRELVRPKLEAVGWDGDKHFYIADARLVPDFHNPRKVPRYYQRIAIDRAIESILKGQRRCLLTLATGTGKTTVAFQICWKLWSAGWNAKADPTRKPRILFLADRNVLVDDPKDQPVRPPGGPGSSADLNSWERGGDRT
jgi:type I restriction enzyme R subunit